MTDPVSPAYAAPRVPADAGLAAPPAQGEARLAVVAARIAGAYLGLAALAKAIPWAIYKLPQVIQLRPELAVPTSLLDLRVRRALAHAVDKQGFADALLARETPDGLMLIDGHLRAETTPQSVGAGAGASPWG